MHLILFLWVENKNGAKNERGRDSPIKISSGENNYKLILYRIHFTKSFRFLLNLRITP